MKFVLNIFIFFIIIYAIGVPLFERSFHPSFDSQKSPKKALFEGDSFSVRAIPFFPFSSYPVFSDLFSPPLISHLDIRTVDELGVERYLEINKHFAPLWRRGMLEALQNHILQGKTQDNFFKGLVGLMLKNVQRKKSMSESFSKVKSLNFYLIKWDWNDWINFRKESLVHSNLKDFKKSNYHPKVHFLGNENVSKNL